MAYPFTLIKVTWGGTMCDGQEIWSNSLNIGNPEQHATLETFSSDNNATDAIVAAIKTFHSAERLIPNSVLLEWVKFSLVNTDGKYVTSPDGNYSFVKTYDFDAVAGTDTVQNAPQLSVAVTLDTLARRGLAKTGRFYVPATGTVNPKGKLYNPQDFSVRAATLLSAINTAVANNEWGFGSMDQVVVASKEREGAIRRVQAVRVGNVVDTQRRRRNALTEVYDTKDITVLPAANDDFSLAA